MRSNDLRMLFCDNVKSSLVNIANMYLGIIGDKRLGNCYAYAGCSRCDHDTLKHFFLLDFLDTWRSSRAVSPRATSGAPARLRQEGQNCRRAMGVTGSEVTIKEPAGDAGCTRRPRG